MDHWDSSGDWRCHGSSFVYFVHCTTSLLKFLLNYNWHVTKFRRNCWKQKSIFKRWNSMSFFKEIKRNLFFEPAEMAKKYWTQFCTEVEWLYHTTVLLDFWKMTEVFSTVALPLYIFTSNIQRLICLHLQQYLFSAFSWFAFFIFITLIIMDMKWHLNVFFLVLGIKARHLCMTGMHFYHL